MLSRSNKYKLEEEEEGSRDRLWLRGTREKGEGRLQVRGERS